MRGSKRRVRAVQVWPLLPNPAGIAADLSYGVAARHSVPDRVHIRARHLPRDHAAAGPEALVFGTEKTGLSNVKQLIKLQQGIPVEKSRELIKALKESKLKVQASIQGDQLRVTGKNRDDLQAAIALLKRQEDFPISLAYQNFRD